MGRTVTVAQMVSRAKTLSDQENQTTISSANWTEFLDRAYRRCYRELAKPGVGYFDTEATITTTGGAVYALPSDHLSTVSISYEVDAAGRRRPLRELMRAERDIFAGNTGTAYAYETVGSNIILYPTPPAGQSYIHLYIPQPTDISAAGDATTLEMATLDGEDFVLWQMVFFARYKLEQDVNEAKREVAEACERVQEDAAMRSFQNSRRQILEDDVMDYGGWDPRMDPADWRYR